MWPFKRSLVSAKSTTPSEVRPSPYIEELQRRSDAVKINYPIGSWIFVRSNEPGPLLVAEVVDYVEFDRDQYVERYILFRTEDGRELFNFNQSPHGYSWEKHQTLLKLEWWEQWNVMCIPEHALFVEEQARDKERKFNEA